MYNVFKRPMFRKGGSSKGTGIMSHVEPRVQANSGYFGQTPIYPVPLNQIKVNAAMGMGDGRVPMMKSFPMDAQVMGASTNVRPTINKKNTDTSLSGFDYGIDGQMPNVEGPSQEEIFAQMFERVTKKAKEGKFLNAEERKFAMDNGIKMYNELASGDTQISLEEVIADKNKSKEIDFSEVGAAGDQITMASESEKIARANALQKKKLDIVPGGDNSGKLTTDIMEEVANEKKILNELLKNDKLTRGENALIIAAALTEPGGINEKVKKATELALPVARSRAKEDKAVTLTAYKAAKEKEKYAQKYKADANKPTQEMKNLNNRANILIQNGDKRDKETIKAEMIKDSMNESADVKAQRAIIKQYLPEIDERHSDVLKYRKQVKEYANKYTGKDITQDKKYINLLEKLSKAETLFGTFIDSNDVLLNTVPQYREVIESLSKTKAKDGGRIGYSMGTDPNEPIEDIESTEVITTGGTETQEKPVLNLSYAELRDRLPPEITDQVVALLASSEEALQDFAYITSQEDVQKFNVKYGVNLVVPPAQPTA
tara:strand:+ start:5375 stop:7009 length:1635 start_codon:yes stop_codon:yes gene_type:complete